MDYLGRYSNEPGPGAIDRKKMGVWNERELRYWNPDNHSEFNPKDWDHVSGKEKARLIKKYGSLKNAHKAYRLMDFKRAEALNNGEFHLMGCVVTARLGACEGESSVWGIESDCGEAYKKEVEAEQTREAMHELREKLEESLKKKKRRARA